MEAGIGILLVVIILIVAAIVSVVFFGGLGALSGRRRKRGSEAEMTGDTDKAAGEERPTHTPARNDEQDVVFHGSGSSRDEDPRVDERATERRAAAPRAR
jgi:hypothetical protein